MLGDDKKRQQAGLHLCEWFNWKDKDADPKPCPRYAMGQWDGLWLCPVHMKELNSKLSGG